MEEKLTFQNGRYRTRNGREADVFLVIDNDPLDPEIGLMQVGSCPYVFRRDGTVEGKPHLDLVSRVDDGRVAD